MSKKHKKFEIPNPLQTLTQIENSPKYSFGAVSDKLNKIKQDKPTFAFDFLSLKNSRFCFNSNLIAGVKEYQRIFQGFKTISTKTYDELSKDRSYHFHEVDFDDTTIPHSDFLKCLVSDTSKINIDNSPTVYQFKVFEEARVFGFIYRSVFYLVFFDRNHDGYKRK